MIDPERRQRSRRARAKVQLDAERVTRFLELGLGARITSVEDIERALEAANAVLAAEALYPGAEDARPTIDFGQQDRAGGGVRLELGRALGSGEGERLVVVEQLGAGVAPRVAHLEVTFKSERGEWLVSALQAAAAAQNHAGRLPGCRAPQTGGSSCEA